MIRKSNPMIKRHGYLRKPEILSFGVTLLFICIASGVMHGQNAPSFWYGYYPDLENQPRFLMFKLDVDSPSPKAWVSFQDEEKFNIPIPIEVGDKDSIHLQVEEDLSFSGTIRDSLFTGQFRNRDGNLLPAIFYNRTYYVHWSGRTQTPEFPPPYCIRDVIIPTPDPEVMLSGTLTLPEGEGPFPAVVLMSGEGPAGRDYTYFAHKPLLVLADQLSKSGIAVLRYDKRGCMESSGNYENSLLTEFANDAYAVLEYLRSQPGINPEKTGLIGHSIGGVLGSMLCSRYSDIPFFVSLAGPAAELSDAFVDFGQNYYMAMGASAEKLETVQKIDSVSMALVLSMKDTTALKNSLYQHISSNYENYPFFDYLLSGSERENAIQEELDYITLPRMLQEIRDFNQKNAISSIKCPVLYLVGDKDLHVRPEKNACLMETYLKEGGNKAFTIKILPGINHFFNHAKTGLPDEIYPNPETMAPVVYETIAAWILEVTRKQDKN